MRKPNRMTCFSPGKDADRTINVKNIRAVEKVDESAFNRKNVSQFPLSHGPVITSHVLPV